MTFCRRDSIQIVSALRPGTAIDGEEGRGWPAACLHGEGLGELTFRPLQLVAEGDRRSNSVSRLITSKSSSGS